MTDPVWQFQSNSATVKQRVIGPRANRHVTQNASASSVAQARPQLETFRSCVRRENAFTNASFDGATRRGIECSGVYNQAKH